MTDALSIVIPALLSGALNAGHRSLLRQAFELPFYLTREPVGAPKGTIRVHEVRCIC